MARLTREQPTIVVREPDADGFHRAPITSCCGKLVAYFDGEARRFNAVQDELHLAELLKLPIVELRCGQCNKAVG